MGSESSDYRHEYEDMSYTEYHFQPTLSFDQLLGKQLHLILSERYKISGSKGTDNLFVLSNLEGWGMQDSVALDLVQSSKELLWRAYDPVNSAYNDLRQNENEFTPTLKLDKGGRVPFDVTLDLPFYVLRERLDYRRDVVDTLAYRNMFAFNPSLNLRNNNWSARFGMSSSTPGLKNLMPYKDSRNPLSVMESNSRLKNNQRLNASMNWRHKLRKENMGGASGRLASDFTYHLNSVALGFTYNERTGAYTYRPENVKGNWAWNTSYNLTLPLGHKQKWWIDSETRTEALHSVDYAAVSGLDEAQLNKVETVNLSEWVKVRYVGKSTKASLLGDIRWRRTWGHRPTQESISAFDYRYGMTIDHTLKSWRTTLNADLCMYSRRGYANAAMNKDEFVVNASITQPIFHGKVTLTLEAHDLFNQISNTTYEVNAQGRTESWYRVTPNYVMLHAVYRFNLHPNFNK
ncbi:MAG: outer membrane beta-barrel family protein [Paraprevotella sp.]|nr:outer membrane beta-barrel family protein [Paraprevotella sp.]